jgi:glucoamylase
MRDPGHTDMQDDAPGHPGISPSWTSSAKDLVGTGIGPSRLWFTTGFGIVNEVYYPRVDIPQIRDLGFIVADGEGFWCEVKRLDSYSVRTPAPGIPALEIVHTHERFALTLRVAPAPKRDVLLLDLSLTGDMTLLPYALLAPHLGGTGCNNVANVMTTRGRTILAAEQGPFGLALASVDSAQCDAWLRAGAGYVGASDGWQDFHRNGAMTWQHRRAGPGNVALMGQLPRRATLALAFGGSMEAAATLAISALIQDFDAVWKDHVERWQAWLPARSPHSELPPEIDQQFRISANVLRTHQDKTYTGAMVASLSIPWGNSKDDVGGYHLVWPRDLVASALALIAIGAIEEARDVLRYLIATQLTDGRWQQNQWLDGTPRWVGVQLDEVAWPVLLASALSERDALAGIEVVDMVRRALGYIMRIGPVTDQDRWEETQGLNAYTLATCIAALVCGAEFLSDPLRDNALLLADDWNVHVEDWTVAVDTDITKRFGARSHYVRTAPARIIETPDAIADLIPVKNRPDGSTTPAAAQVSTDFLQLVRLGLRAPDDPTVLDTLRVVDGLLKVETPSGPCWYRYNGDGYGEAEDGSPYEGIGRGRLWPLLTAERGHYALAAGADPLPFLEAMVRMTGRCGLLPEQIWDTEAIPHANLFPGKPTGSAMPLVWAHAEFARLAVGARTGASPDRPEAVWRRYGGAKPKPPARCYWSPRMPVTRIAAGQTLRLLLDGPTVVHWSADGWATEAVAVSHYSTFNLHVADLQTRELARGQRVAFRWDAREHSVEIA